MDLELMASLLAVADAGTITDAAQRIHISQSALSRRLQQLEAELGAELFVRGRHGAQLTVLGRQAAAHARTILGRYEELRRDLAEHQGLERGVVRLGGGATVTSFLLPPAIAAFRSAHPGIHFYVKEAGSLEIAADVASGQIELGLVTLPVAEREVDVRELLVDDIVLVGPVGHPFAERSIRLSELQGQPMIAFEPGSAIRQVIDSRLRRAGVDVEVTMELRSIPSMLRMVVSTGGLAFVSRLSLAGQDQVRPVAVPRLAISRRIGVATREGFPLSPAGQAFLGQLAAVALKEP